MDFLLSQKVCSVILPVGSIYEKYGLDKLYNLFIF